MTLEGLVQNDHPRSALFVQEKSDYIFNTAVMVISRSRSVNVTSVNKSHSVMFANEDFRSCEQNISAQRKDMYDENRHRKRFVTNTSNHDFASESATKVYALVFPQFHEDGLNNELWGDSFTDWDNLVSAPTLNKRGDVIIDPLLPGPLGYYDMNDKHIRHIQGRLAHEYGVDGFIYHHYWFYQLKHNNPLSKPLESMLLDGEPNIKFAFNWVDESWTTTWHGQKDHEIDSLLIPQEFPPDSSPMIQDHYNHLRWYFHHQNYIKVNGCPLFLIHNHSNPSLMPILQRLRQFAMDDHFPSPGLHIVSRISPHHSPVVDRKKIPFHYSNHSWADALFHYPDTLSINYRKPLGCPKKKTYHMPVYLSTVTRFDNTPRRTYENAVFYPRWGNRRQVLRSFEKDLLTIIWYDMCCHEPMVRSKGGKFVVINAWNEWAEGMTLEPSNVYGYGFLEVIRNVKMKLRTLDCNGKAVFF
jgi:hypothetical protein